MFAGINTTKAKPLLEQALSGRNLRNQLISSNLANVSTPFYKARDVDFESALKEKVEEIYNNKQNQILQLAQTNDAHFPRVDFPKNSFGTIYLRDGHMARNDANTVDLDVETSEMSKNAMMISAIDAALSKSGAIFKAVIEASGKI
ncbi:flagellar basal body rod protein FlgB [Campylobacter sp. RM12327]|uniref:Flagellar basal body rod protein FlgB n=1 Tax=Campylobacter sputorum subsp. sputorum TaxID=32024 RepID=A0A381DHX0_9BACT|nr:MULTISPECIES: flagellar basal body rod protein FlgB [Campylobacter]ASM35339.1 flagellar proximal rod protein [Campylobacter sputorum aubsp. sputorum RM3237]ASM37037.1 flagellar proximal rod protein [Campylobacter sputorum bv. faecalis CCUG 20703]ASM40296.1 flagellar proximal rod protein [Campylobacter sputorum]KAB0582917.1 flagellar basal body rod protein FlgB [Campylobacter sputorum subsp. sputorum]MBE7357435.1 flagellar basal body rod protein FlgB [Campylobacter sp. RM11302]